MFLSEALPGLSLNPKALFDVLSSSCFLYMGGGGGNRRYSRSCLIFCLWRDFPGDACNSLGFLISPPSPLFFYDLLCDKCVVVVKMRLFSKWNLTVLMLLALPIVVLRWDGGSLTQARHRETCVEQEARSGEREKRDVGRNHLIISPEN